MIDSIHLQKAEFLEKYHAYDCQYQIKSNGETYRGYYSTETGWKLAAERPDCSEPQLENILDWLWSNYQWDKVQGDLNNVNIEFVSEIQQTTKEINKLISMLNNNPSSDLDHILKQTLQTEYGLDFPSKS
jgi:hypothetical protein